MPMRIVRAYCAIRAMRMAGGASSCVGPAIGTNSHLSAMASLSLPRGPSRRARLLLVASLAGSIAAAAGRASAAGGCAELAYSFQPDCYQPKGDGVCGQTLQHMDFGPQIAVWIETADHTLIDTLMVTSLTATRGIGNRPGIWNFRSSPRFPYGKRWMSLPLWAFARGKLFDAAFMQDDRETWMGFHEAHSSPELYFCRPLGMSDLPPPIDVVTCPSQYPRGFNSAKGKLEATTKSYYPPRNDVTTFINQDCDDVGGSLPGCHVSAATYGALNDLDAVSAATPPYGQPYARTWHVPSALPVGDYALVVEINKEYDTNDAHSYPSYEDPNLPSYGIDGNFGQPSIVFRVPVRLGEATPVARAVSQIAGYSKWTGDAPLDGTLLPPDGTISTTVPGSGEMRLVAFDGPGGVGRVHVALQRCPVIENPCADGGCPDASAGDAPAMEAASEVAPETTTSGTCEPPPPPPTSVSALAVDSSDATTVSLSFLNAASEGGPVDHYDIRYRAATTLTEADFDSGEPAPFVVPGPPGQPAALVISKLKPATDYVVGVRALDFCSQRSPLVVIPVRTNIVKFTKLSGCFVATAAYGSALEPEVAALRRARDRLRAGSPLFATAADLYTRAGPAAADVVGGSDLARGLARRVIAPFAGLAEALDALPPPGRASR
jgi:hypothetical protein